MHGCDDFKSQNASPYPQAIRYAFAMHLLPLFCALQDTFWVARKRTSRTFGLMGVVPDSGVEYSGVDVTSWLVVLGRLRARFRSSGGSQQRVRLFGWHLFAVGHPSSCRPFPSIVLR